MGLEKGSAGVLAARRSVWALNPFKRGSAIENIIRLRRNLHRTFPTIDRFENGIATSIKSIDLAAKTYKNERALERVLKNYVTQLARFKGARVGKQVVRGTDINQKVLHLVTPSDISPSLLQRVRTFAKEKGVDMTTEILKE